MPDHAQLDGNSVVEAKPLRAPARISLNKLFLSLQEQMIAKMQTNRAFVRHHSTMGAASEQAWLAMLRAYLPERYRADSAFVIDSAGDLSEQIDIVIYDRQYSPLIFQQDGVLYVPAESVYAVFDVKQELYRETLHAAAGKARSVRRLKRTSVPVPHAGGTYQPKPPFEITAGVLALECHWFCGSLAESVDRVLSELPPENFLNLGCAVHGGAFEAWLRQDLEEEKHTRENPEKKEKEEKQEKQQKKERKRQAKEETKEETAEGPGSSDSLIVEKAPQTSALIFSFCACFTACNPPEPSPPSTSSPTPKTSSRVPHPSRLLAWVGTLTSISIEAPLIGVPSSSLSPVIPTEARAASEVGGPAF